MKKSVWQILTLSAVVVLTACNKKTDEATQEAAKKEVPMTAEAADPVGQSTEEQPADSAGQATSEEASDHAESDSAAEEAGLDDDKEIAEVIEFDEAAAATATQDAEVVDEAAK